MAFWDKVGSTVNQFFDPIKLGVRISGIITDNIFAIAPYNKQSAMMLCFFKKEAGFIGSARRFQCFLCMADPVASAAIAGQNNLVSIGRQAIQGSLNDSDFLFVGHGFALCGLLGRLFVWRRRPTGAVLVR
jgi:hypothetical protein